MSKIQLHVAEDAITEDEYAGLLHFDGEQAAIVVQAMYDTMIANARALNPSVPPEAKTCGGCVMLVLGNLLDKVMLEGGADYDERYSYRNNFIRRLHSHQLHDDLNSSIAGHAGGGRSH